MTDSKTAKKIEQGEPTETRPPDNRTHTHHRCMRCTEEFECKYTAQCSANYDVLRIHGQEHCPLQPDWDWIRAYGKRMATLPSVPQQGQAWVKVSERLPNQEKCCLWCKVPICEPPVIGAIDDGDFDYAEYFTHWMALPNEFFPDPRNAYALAASRSEEATAQEDKCVIRRAQALATDIMESSLVHSDLTEWLLAYRKSEIYRTGAPAAGSTERDK